MGMKTFNKGQSVQVFFDGDCPLCLKEINLLRRLDRRKLILFTDIAAPDFSAQDYGMQWSDFMDRIQGRLPDGSFIEGVEVFRQLYTAVGLGPLVRLTRLPIVRELLDWGYRVFAKNRLRLTGRCNGNSCELPSP